jgi:nitroreductase
MMRPSNDLPTVYVCLDPVDFRRQIDGLAAIVQDTLALDPFSEQLFAFTNRRKTHRRVSYWERSGFVLWTKRLEQLLEPQPHVVTRREPSPDRQQSCIDILAGPRTWPGARDGAPWPVCSAPLYSKARAPRHEAATMDLDEVMRTTFAAREFTDEPLPDDVLHRILDQARFAASGGNRQGWRVIVSRDREVRARLVELMIPPMKRYVAQVQAGEMPWNTIDPSKLDEAAVAATPPPDRLLDPVRQAPVVLLVGLDLSVVASMDRDLDRVGIVSGASIYPFVWNILLAARAEGFGGVITTFLTAAEPEVRELLGVPAHVALAATVPLGRPAHPLTRLRRRPVEAFAMRERWGGAPFQAP